ncbi:unnamed protein product [Lota lota]
MVSGQVTPGSAEGTGSGRRTGSRVELVMAHGPMELRSWTMETVTHKKVPVTPNPSPSELILQPVESGSP